MKNKHVEKKFYFPTHGSIEEMNEAVARVNKYIDDHEWPYPPSYYLGKDSIEIFGLRRKREDTGEVPVVNLEDRVIGAKKSKPPKHNMEDILKRFKEDNIA